MNLQDLSTPDLIRFYKRQARMIFVGIAIRHQPKLADGVVGPIKSEKVLKFNRTALHDLADKSEERVDSRLVGGEDRMLTPVGKPGSQERLDALLVQYESMGEKEESPFGDD